MNKTETKVADVECITYELLWLSARHQLLAAKSHPEKAGYFRLAFMILTYMTIEGYVNHVGEILFPEVWKNEQQYFSRGKKYPGSLGKIRFIAHKVGMHISETDRPFVTVKELKRVRDTLAHARTERFTKEIEIPKGSLANLVTPKIFELLSDELQNRAIIDVPDFLHALNRHTKLAFPDEPNLNDHILNGMMVSQTA
jgi:hypothetical protein